MKDRIVEKTLETNTEITRAYAALSNDHNPLHLDAAFAARTPFGQPIAHGAMALDLLLNAIDETFGASQGEVMDIRFTAPVKVGERITAGGQWNGTDYDVWVRKDDGTDVLKGSFSRSAAE